MKDNEKVGQAQLYDLLTGRDTSWQQIIYDLIQSEQLDPWDIDLALLTKSYIDKIKELEETEFYISSKIFLAAAILLRIKSELLIKRYIRSLDEILFGKPEEKEKAPFYIELEDVDLFPRTPLPRQRKVTLQELMSALNKAIDTEQRRIKKEIDIRQALKNAAIVLPTRTINLREKIREIYNKILAFFSSKQEQQLTFSQLAGTNKIERIGTFVPLLHLDFHQKIDLDQQEHFGEIYITMKKFRLFKSNDENNENPSAPNSPVAEFSEVSENKETVIDEHELDYDLLNDDTNSKSPEGPTSLDK